MEKVVFLDRDGTVSKDSKYHIKSWDEFHFLPNAKRGIKVLSDHGYKIIFITNQSVIARQMVTTEELARIHSNMVNEIKAAGGKVEKIYYCPHHPDDGCSCRKPNPGLLERAMSENHINASQSYMVGDRLMDIQAGKTVGTKTILIRNERGLKELRESDIHPDYIAKDMMDVAHFIINNFKEKEGR